MKRMGKSVIFIFIFFLLIGNSKMLTVTAESTDVPDWANSYITNSEGVDYQPGSKIEIVSVGEAYSFTVHAKSAWTFSEEGNGAVSMSPDNGQSGETKVTITANRTGNISIQIIMPGLANDTYTIDVKDPVPGGVVTAHYQDESGKKIAEDETYTGNVGETYQTEQKSIAGYTLKEVEGNRSGKYTESAQDVIYIYSKDPVPGGVVTAHYQDESGKKIAEDESYTGNVGENYQTEQKSIAGYTLKEVEGNRSGKYTESAQDVTYIYSKDPVPGGAVTAHYQDESGKKIAEDKSYTGNVGEKYVTTVKNISGWEFMHASSNTSGVFTSNNQVVTYIYDKSKNQNNTDKAVPKKKFKHENKKMNLLPHKKLLPSTGDNRIDIFLYSLAGLWFICLGVFLLTHKKIKKHE